MGFFDFIFGSNKPHVEEYLKNDAIILDVRSYNEYQNNHIVSAIHIPLPELKNRIEEIKTLNKPVITHCASGVRSATAARLLKSNGIDAVNGGGITSLMRQLD